MDRFLGLLLAADLWTVIDRLSGVLGILGATASAGTLFLLWGLRLHRRRGRFRRDRYDELFEDAKGVQGLKPVALVVSLTPNKVSAVGDVLRFFAGCYDKPVPVVPVEMQGVEGESGVKDMCDRFVRAMEEIRSRGCDEVHIFVNGPVAGGVILGAQFVNDLPARIYHYNGLRGDYEFWGPIVKLPLEVERAPVRDR